MNLVCYLFGKFLGLTGFAPKASWTKSLIEECRLCEHLEYLVGLNSIPGLDPFPDTHISRIKVERQLEIQTRLQIQAADLSTQIATLKTNTVPHTQSLESRLAELSAKRKVLQEKYLLELQSFKLRHAQAQTLKNDYHQVLAVTSSSPESPAPQHERAAHTASSLKQKFASLRDATFHSLSHFNSLRNEIRELNAAISDIKNQCVLAKQQQDADLNRLQQTLSQTQRQLHESVSLCESECRNIGSFLLNSTRSSPELSKILRKNRKSRRLYRSLLRSRSYLSRLTASSF